MVFEGSNKADDLIKILRSFFTTFGIAEELATDGGPQFTAEATKAFLKSYQCKHRISSVGNPHSNCRAEVAVKTVKRMLMANTSPTGSLDVDTFKRAMLVYRNSIDPETKTSPACMLFGRPVRDAIPAPLGKYCPHPTWRETLINREKALARRHNREREKWEQHTKQLPPLKIHDHVYIQNIIGNHPLRWERTGVVVECKPHNQYLIRTDGSGRVTLRNRKHLRKFTPFYPVSPPRIQIPAKESTHVEDQVYTNPERIIDHGPTHTDELLIPTKEGTHVEGQLNIDPENLIDPGPTQTEEIEDNSDYPLTEPDNPKDSPHTPSERKSPNRSSGHGNEKPPKKKLPMALRRLRPHNNPGKAEG